MKTTLELNDQLLAQARKLAADQRRSLRAVVEDALRLLIADQTEARPAGVKPDLPVCDAGKPIRGIDLNDTSKLRRNGDRSSVIESSGQSQLRGGDITDAWFASLAVEHDCEWWTGDSGFTKFPGLRLRLPT